MMYKTLSILILLSILALTSSAQREFATDRGSLMLGGNISLSSSGGDAYEADGSRTFNFSLNPNFEIFVAPSFSLGGEVLVSYSSYGNSNYSNFGIGPSFTYFIAGHQEQSVYPYIGLAGLFYARNFSGEFSSSESLNSESVVKLGVMFMLSKAVALDTQFRFTSSTLDIADNPSSGNNIYLGVGIKAFIF